MKALFKIVFFLLCVQFVNAQTPIGSPTINSTGWAKYRYLQSDSGYILAVRDTNWLPRFPTAVLWMNPGVDTSIWYFPGARPWKRISQTSDAPPPTWFTSDGNLPVTRTIDFQNTGVMNWYNIAGWEFFDVYPSGGYQFLANSTQTQWLWQSGSTRQILMSNAIPNGGMQLVVNRLNPLGPGTNPSLRMDTTGGHYMAGMLSGGYDASDSLMTINGLDQVKKRSVATLFTATSGLEKTGVDIRLGQLLGNGSNPAALTRYTEIPLAGNKLYFTGLPSTSDTPGVSLANRTAATLGNQQASLPLVFEGSGYKTNSPGASVNVSFKVDLLPVQGVLLPTSRLRFQSYVTGGPNPWSDRLSINSDAAHSIFSSTGLQVTNGGINFTAGATVAATLLYSPPFSITSGSTYLVPVNQLTYRGNVQAPNGVTNLYHYIPQITPATGTGEFNVINVAPTVNQGSATGITRGVHIVPQIAGAPDFRALEVRGGRSVFHNTLSIYDSTQATNVVSRGLYVGGSMGMKKDSVKIITDVAPTYTLVIDTTTGEIKRTNVGGGSINLSTSVAPTTVTVNNSGGTSAVLPAATFSDAGVFTARDKQMLDSAFRAFKSSYSGDTSLVFWTAILRPSWGGISTGDTLRWSLLGISDDHDTLYVTSVRASSVSGKLAVKYPHISRMLLSIANPDEALAGKGVTMGFTGGLDSSNLSMYIPSSPNNLTTTTGTGSAWNSGLFVWNPGGTNVLTPGGGILAGYDAYAGSVEYIGTNNYRVKYLIAGVANFTVRFQLWDITTNTLVTTAPTSSDILLYRRALTPTPINLYQFTSTGAQASVFNATAPNQTSGANIWVFGVGKRSPN